MRTEKQRSKKVRRQRGDAADASTPPKGRFRPNYAVAPGETLRETLESAGMNQAQLAQRVNCSEKSINENIKGIASITAEMAIKLESGLGVPAAFWNNLEKNYQKILARL